MKGVSFALGEVAVFFMIVAALGAAIGWVLRDWVFANKAEELDASLREERAGYRRMESAFGSTERKLERAITDRDKTIEAIRKGTEGEAIVLAKQKPRPGMVMHPSALEAVRAMRTGEPLQAVQSAVESAPAELVVEPPPRGGRAADIEPPPEPAERDSSWAGSTHGGFAGGSQDVGGTPPDDPIQDESLPNRPVLDGPVLDAPVLDELISQEERFAADRGPDDLKRIRGIGPTLERRVNEQGITKYRELAALDETQLGELADAIRLSRTRLNRDDWVGSARALDAELHNQAR